MTVKLSYGDVSPDWEKVLTAQIAYEIAHPVGDVSGVIYRTATGQQLSGSTLVADKLVVWSAYTAWVKSKSRPVEQTKIFLAAARIASSGSGAIHQKYPFMGALANIFTQNDERQVADGRLSLWHLAERAGVTDYAVEILAEMQDMNENNDKFTDLVYGEMKK